MAQLLVQEVAFSLQRAKTYWLRDWDLNTKFVHIAALSRRKVNMIVSLMHTSNKRITDEEKLCDVASECFVDLFQAQNSDIDAVIKLIHESISFADNDMLTAPFVIENLKKICYIWSEINVLDRIDTIRKFFKNSGRHVQKKFLINVVVDFRHVLSYQP